MTSRAQPIPRIKSARRKATTPRLEGAGAGGSADSAGQPHRRDASANEASSPSTPLWTPQAVEAAAAASSTTRAPPAGLLALKLATSWGNPDPKGLRGAGRGWARDLLAAVEELPGASDSRVGCSLPDLGGAIVFFKCASVVFEGSLNW